MVISARIRCGCRWTRREALTLGDGGAFVRAVQPQDRRPRRNDVADRGAHQAGQPRRGGDEHPFLPHFLQDIFAELRSKRALANAAATASIARRNAMPSRSPKVRPCKSSRCRIRPSASSEVEIRQRPPSDRLAPKRRSSMSRWRMPLSRGKIMCRRPDRRREGFDRVVQIVGFAAQHDQIEGRRAGRRPEPSAGCGYARRRRALDDEPGLGQPCGAARPDQERHILSCFQKPAAKISTDCACADNECSHN